MPDTKTFSIVNIRYTVTNNFMVPSGTESGFIFELKMIKEPVGSAAIYRRSFQNSLNNFEEKSCSKISRNKLVMF